MNKLMASGQGEFYKGQTHDDLTHVRLVVHKMLRMKEIGAQNGLAKMEHLK